MKQQKITEQSFSERLRKDHGHFLKVTQDLFPRKNAAAEYVIFLEI